MELTKLRYFVEVCRHRNMSRAAEALFVSQQNVSKAVSSLEEELDAQLLVRSGGRLEITPDGEYLLQKASWIIMEADVISSHFRSRSESGGTIRVAGTQGLLYRCGRTTQKLLLGGSSGFHVAFFQHPFQQMRNELLSGSVRFGLAIMHPELAKDFDVTVLGRLRTVFAVSSSHPLASAGEVTPYQLSRYPLIGPGPDSAEGSALEAYFRDRGYRPYMLLYSNEASEVLELTGNSEGIIGCVTERDLVRSRKEDVVPLKLTEEMDELQIALISRRDAPANRWEIAFRNALTASFRED